MKYHFTLENQNIICQNLVNQNSSQDCVGHSTGPFLFAQSMWTSCYSCDFNAYLCDFGLARLIETSVTHLFKKKKKLQWHMLQYVAPGYAMTCYSRSTTPKGCH